MILKDGAVDATNAFGAFGNFINLGVIVIFLLLVLTRKLRTEGEVDEKNKEIEELKASLKEITQQSQKLTEHYQSDILPALMKATDTTGDLLAYLSHAKTRDGSSH